MTTIVARSWEQVVSKENYKLPHRARFYYCPYMYEKRILCFLGRHFGAPRVSFTQVFLFVFSLLSCFSLAFLSFLTSLLSSVVSLLSALVSLLSSRFSSVYPAARRFSRSGWDPPTRQGPEASRTGSSKIIRY